MLWPISVGFERIWACDSSLEPSCHRNDRIMGNFCFSAYLPHIQYELLLNEYNLCFSNFLLKNVNHIKSIYNRKKHKFEC